ncbi:MAG: hypothetical protein ACP6IU_12440 [Candidatus Asgardarchaeia archaeon]
MSASTVVKGFVSQIPEIVLSAFKIKKDSSTPFQINSSYEHVNVIIIHNLGLKEVIQYKPSFLLSNAGKILALFTNKPTIHDVLLSMTKTSNYNLFDILETKGIKTIIIGRNYLERFVGRLSRFINTKTDMETYVKVITYVNRINFLLAEFLDLNKRNNNLTKIISENEIKAKIVKKTDDFIKLIHKQVKPNSLNLIIGVPNVDNPAINIPVGFVIPK